ncbi:hypothetical protein C4J95_2070 [Pseudomonas orientalis]|uniref:polymorphic toxin type 15 domain-containing protein n=1 Tax=Pseudomonas orientalis TaxID=76758 RepID=UPI000F55C98C|nr:polymorphic toxin type 15 domain-containing protein [Pseudomonas orientalis]AZE99532.1 hypothetical protein C4J95_2070 [Pseudomonas orientalis]
MAEVIDLPPLHVQAIRVPVQPPPNSIVGPAEVFLQQGESGGVQLDAFWRDAMGNEVHESKEMQEEEYEALRARYMRTEQATLPPFSSFKSGNTIGRVVGETAPAAVPASQANPPIEAETEEEGITGEQILDGIQLGLDVVGLIPVVGEVADIASGIISLFRGDYVGAGLSLLSAIPFVGYLGTAGKAARYSAKMAEASGKASKEIVDKAAKETADRTAKNKSGEAAARKQQQGAKVKPKKLPKKVPECFDPRNSKKYKKMSEAEKKEYLREYAKQLKRQESAINNMSAKNFADARRQFNKTKLESPTNSGRNPKATAAQETYRRDRAEAIERSIYESTVRKNRGIDPKKAESHANARTQEIMDSMAALHEPDMVAGGWNSPAPSGLGDKRVNSAIGGSWNQKERVKLLESAAEGAVARGDGSDMMNVELTICPPGKKGRKR